MKSTTDNRTATLGGALKRARFMRTIPGFIVLLIFSTVAANASTIFTDSSGLTTETFNSSGSDGVGDTISGGFFYNFGGQEVEAFTDPVEITFTFASPLMAFGFDMGEFDSASITAVTLSNSDTLTTSLPYDVSPGDFYGITSSTDFTSATISFTPNDSADIKDFRISTAAPEPATLALIVPVLLAGLAGLRLRKRTVR